MPKNKHERPICEHYAKGYCAFGFKCRLYHPPRSSEPEKTVIPMRPNQPDLVQNVPGPLPLNDQGLILIPNPQAFRPVQSSGPTPGNHASSSPISFVSNPNPPIFRPIAIHPIYHHPPNPPPIEGVIEIRHLESSKSPQVEEKEEDQLQFGCVDHQELREPQINCENGELLKEEAEEFIRQCAAMQIERHDPCSVDNNSSTKPKDITLDNAAQSEASTTYNPNEDEYPSLEVAHHQSSGKRSKLEAKREARKTRKQARKKEMLARMKSTTPPEPETVEEEKEKNTECIASPTVSNEMNENNNELEEGIVTEFINSPKETSVTDDTVTASENLESTKEAESVDTGRKMTKREKKREERRMLNALKKKEKLKKKEASASEELNQRKDQLRLLFEQEKHLECAIETAKLLNQYPNDAELFAIRRDCYFAMGKIKHALRDAEEAASITKDQDCLLMLLRLQLTSGAVNKAQNTLDILGPLCPEAEKNRLNEINQGMTSVNRALEAEDWNRAMEKVIYLENYCSDSDWLHLRKCEARLNLHIFPEAKSMLDKLKVDFVDDPYYAYLQSLHEYYVDRWWIKEDPDVLRSFANVMDLSARFAKIYDRARAMKSNFYTAQLWIKNDQKERAKQLILGCYGMIDQNNPAFLADLHCLLGTTLDSDEEKMKELSKSIKFKETSEAYVERGNIYRSKRKYDEALSDYENASRLNPSCPDIQRLLEQTRRNANTSQRQGAAMRTANRDFYAILGKISSSFDCPTRP